MINGHEIQVDGYLARRFNMHSVLGSILDPAADKALMTTLTIALAVKGMLPCTYPLPPSLLAPSALRTNQCGWRRSSLGATRSSASPRSTSATRLYPTQ